MDVRTRSRVLLLSGLLFALVSGIAATAAGAKEAVTLRWFMRWDDVRVQNVAIPVKEEFERLHPEIRIELENNGPSSDAYWEKLQTRVAGGVAPDILYPATHYGYTLAAAGQLLDVRPYIQRDRIDLRDYLSNITDLYSYQGQIWALPVDWARMGVFYNADLFEKSGLRPPGESWSWDDFLSDARKLTVDKNGDGRPDQFAIRDFSSYWPVLAWSHAGTGLYNDLRRPTETFIDSPQIIKGIQFLADLRNRYHVIPTSADLRDWQNVFPAGTAAMEMGGHWRIPVFMETLDFRWNIATLPRGTQSVNRIDGSGFAVSKQTQHPEEAWEFVKFLAAPRGVGVRKLLELQQYTPVVRPLIQSELFLRPKGLEGINKLAFLAGDGLYSMYEPLGAAYDVLDELISGELKNVWNGKQPAAEAAQKLGPVLRAKLKEL